MVNGRTGMSLFGVAQGRSERSVYSTICHIIFTLCSCNKSLICYNLKLATNIFFYHLHKYLAYQYSMEEVHLCVFINTFMPPQLHTQLY